MTAQWQSDGHLKEEGKEADRKQHGGGWWRQRGTGLAGHHGPLCAVLLPTDGDGRVTFGSCVPPGTERFKVKVRI